MNHCQILVDVDCFDVGGHDVQETVNDGGSSHNGEGNDKNGEENDDERIQQNGPIHDVETESPQAMNPPQ